VSLEKLAANVQLLIISAAILKSVLSQLKQLQPLYTGTVPKATLMVQMHLDMVQCKVEQLCAPLACHVMLISDDAYQNCFLLVLITCGMYSRVHDAGPSRIRSATQICC
jgi:hypothetical protein